MTNFDETKLVLFTKDKFSTQEYICKIKIGHNKSRWLHTRRFSTPIAGFYTKQFIDNIDINIGGANIGSKYGNCIAMKNGWFKLQFFLNDPVLPLNALTHQTISFSTDLDIGKSTYEWPDIYYMPVTETVNNIFESSIELIVQNTDGFYNCLCFENGLGGLVYFTEDSFKILPYDRIVKYLKGEIKLYNSSANNDKADSMNIAKKMFRECKEFLKAELKLCKETNLLNL